MYVCVSGRVYVLFAVVLAMIVAISFQLLIAKAQSKTCSKHFIWCAACTAVDSCFRPFHDKGVESPYQGCSCYHGVASCIQLVQRRMCVIARRLALE